MKKRYYSLLISFLLATTFLHAQPAFIRDSLENYIVRGMKDWDIPGLSIVIVKDGKTVVMKGFGVRDIESKEPVDENTLFMIASNTKLFTATALSLLEYRNKLSLNDKITKYIPDYRLYDSLSTSMVTIKDMLTHRIGTKPSRVISLSGIQP
jgi:CubicO group peptidase (beta-lactamase class C family)